MLDKIDAQIKLRKPFVKRNFYHAHSRGEGGQISNDLYPFCQDYFHELNPIFTFNLNRTEYLNYAHATTIRDGSAGMGAFILKHFQILPKIDGHFFIREDLANLVPPKLRDQFSCWRIHQKEQIKISDAKSIFIYGIVSKQAFPSKSLLEAQLQVLKNISPKAEIDIFLPMRQNPLGNIWKETYLGYEIIEMIKALIPNNKINFLLSKDVMEKSVWKGVYCLDIMNDNLIITDNYLNHHMARRGGTISSFSAQSTPEKVFKLDLSFNHAIEYYPLPNVSSKFSEMVFYKKQNPGKNPLTDPSFHALLKE